MEQGSSSLSDQERAELEQLRAEKAERAELERLRAEKAARMAAERFEQDDDAQRQRIAEARARGRALMEPDDDLSMPTGQKIVLVGVALIVAAIVALFFFGPK